MCGICGYIGNGKAAPIILSGLRKIDYRGYDSAGESTAHDGELFLEKDVGKIDEINKRLHLEDLPGNVGLGHTRWATTGGVTKENAHPHTDCAGSIAIVHNGVLQSYSGLKEELISRGHRFRSETDTEVFAHLVEEAYEDSRGFGRAFHKSLGKLKPNDQFAFIGIHKDENVIAAAKKGSPLCVGRKGGETFVASDPLAFLEYTNQVMHLKDGDVLTVDGKIEFMNRGGHGEFETHPWTPEALDKKGYKFFTLKEISEIPAALQRVLSSTPKKNFGYFADKIDNANKVILTACGTSSYAADAYKLLAKELFREEPRVIISNHFAQEAVVGKGDVVIGISQSGTTRDVIEAIKYAKEKGAETLSIVNVPGSDLTRETERSIYTQAGAEKGVASTKNFINQLGVLYDLALYRAERLGHDVAEIRRELSNIPEKIYKTMVETKPQIGSLSKELKDAKYIAVLGAGPTYPVSMEAALKWRELARKYAMGFPAGELKHGTLALIEEGTMVFGNYNTDSSYDSIHTSSEEAVSRGATHIAIQPAGMKKLPHAKYTIGFPDTDPLLTPFLQTSVHYDLVTQTTLELGYDLDYLRNLAKSVTV